MTDYSWLDKEAQAIRNKNFFVFEPCFTYSIAQFERAHGALPEDYRAFVTRFGNARLFRDPRSNWHRVKVLSPPKHFTNYDHGTRLFQVGYYLNTGYACYLFNNGSVQENGAIFQGSEYPIRKLAPTFEEWFLLSFRRARKAFPKREWAEMTSEPPDFNETEREIVAAIALFDFVKRGVSENGCVMIEVINNSTMQLPYLTVGVRFGRLEGTCALPVIGISPGTKQVIEHPCYKDAADPDEVELFKLPLPTPDMRRYFLELRDLRERC